jgi:hypothetical protein
MQQVVDALTAQGVITPSVQPSSPLHFDIKVRPKLRACVRGLCRACVRGVCRACVRGVCRACVAAEACNGVLLWRQRSLAAYTIGALSVVLEITDVNVTSELSARGPLQGSGLDSCACVLRPARWRRNSAGAVPHAAAAAASDRSVSFGQC